MFHVTVNPVTDILVYSDPTLYMRDIRHRLAMQQMLQGCIHTSQTGGVGLILDTYSKCS